MAMYTVDFRPVVFHTVSSVCAAVTLKVWWSILRLLTCHRLLTFVYKNRQFVPINQKLYHNNLGVPVIMTHRVYMNISVISVSGDNQPVA